MMKHTCDVQGGGRASCDPCMKLEGALWEAINAYVITCRGNPELYVYGNTPRMKAVCDVNAVVQAFVRDAVARQRLDDIVIDELVKGSNAAAKAACDRGTEINRLRDALSAARFALCSTTERAEDAIEMIDRVLDDKGEAR